MRDARPLADGVGAPVDAIAEVDVQVSRGAEHGCVAPGLTPVGVAAGIVAPAVGLDLDDPSRPATRHQHFVEQVRGNQAGVSLVEPTRDRTHLTVGPQPRAAAVPSPWFRSGHRRR